MSVEYDNGVIVGMAVVNGLVTGNGKKYAIGDTISPKNLNLTGIVDGVRSYVITG